MNRILMLIPGIGFIYGIYLLLINSKYWEKYDFVSSAIYQSLTISIILFMLIK